jgi:acylpyruvate hydrolase
MKLVTIGNTATGSPGAMLRSEEILHFSKAAKPGTLEVWIPGSIRAILEGGKDALGLVRQLVDRVEALPAADRESLRASGGISPANTPLMAPIPNPRLLLAAGLAFKSHLAEMAGTPTPKNPTAFLKSVHSIVGPDATVAVPPDAPAHIDYEGELGIVFGRTCHRVGVDEAMDYVAGYTAANDISARDWVKPVWEAKEAWEARLTWETNIMGKQYDSFTPLGPVLTTVDDIAEPEAMQIITRLNGKVMQSAPVSDLIFTIAQTVAYFSKWYTFQPGDILLSGTPAGVGVGRKPPIFMKSGDVIEIDISGIGVLRNVLKA